MIAKRVTLSTGILRRPNKTKFALVDVVNFNRERSRRVTVQVFDWSTGSPIPLKVSPCNNTKQCTVTVAGGKSVFLFADVSKVRFKYEVRITQHHDRKLVTNVTGVTNAPFTPQEGDTVLQSSLIRIK
ncbi:hypothetical protein [Paenibacillus sp. V4I7]|uniref:hypothetical protein n=1 Tax=Paenibacillus sp. V4I7 TaxID=3042307 RepID=UPI002785D5A3|nr:hypothetical protein [Paenibacillus sp. V4I7]MDQ0899589.1 uncharacterized protein (DUF2141 family) [Paenibacillus sp. V4I7]